MAKKSKRAFRTISEVADELNVPQHVLRFWETKFHQVKPMKRGGNRRYYRPRDMDLLHAIQHHLYSEGYTIKGVQKLMKDLGVKKFVETWKAGAPETPEAPEPKKKKPPAQKAHSKPEPKPTMKDQDEDEYVKVSKDLLRALVEDLRALRQLIDRLPD